MSIKVVGNKCCGCRACEQKCKLNAISFKTDEYGFEYPEVSADLCVECGACDNVCPAINTVAASEALNGGAAYALDAQTKYDGSSGGMFGTFAKALISNGGVVFGAAFDDELKLKTTKAETVEELKPLYKSKYLLCDTSHKFEEIERELKSGRQVLYCSSPCQIAALKLYLKKDYDNLIVIDFVCHGVGSQTLFDRSIEYTEKKKAIKINKVTLRYKKEKAASKYYYRYDYSKGEKSHAKVDLYFSFPYYYAYCKQLACRDSCYACKFATRERVGDITIADFHTVEKHYPSIDRFAGVSMLLINTAKGKELFDLVKDKLFYQETDKEVLYGENRFSDEVVIPKGVPAFRKSVAEEPFEVTVERFLKPSRDWKKIMYYKSPKFVRKMALKIFGRNL